MDRAGRRPSPSGPRRYGFGLRHHADLRAPRGVPAGRRVAPTSSARRCTTSRTRAAAASRCDPRAPRSVARAFAQHHPVDAVEGLVRRAALPLRASAEGALPPALAGRRRGAGRRRPAVDVEVIALAHGFYRATSVSRDAHAEHQLDGRRRRPWPLRRACCTTTCSQHGDALGDDVPRAGRRQPAPGPRLQGPRLAGRHRARAADHRVPRRRRPRRTSKRCSTASTGSGSRTRSTRGSCAGSTTTRAPRSSSPATRSTPRRTASAAAVATTAWSSRWAASPRRASGSASASSGC